MCIYIYTQSITLYVLFKIFRKGFYVTVGRTFRYGVQFVFEKNVIYYDITEGGGTNKSLKTARM